jgi:hypothetical protein
VKGIHITSALATWMAISTSSSQTIVYSDDFSSSQGSAYTSSGQIGTSGWSVTRSGDDWGARIDLGVMTLNNDISASAGANGWVYSSIPMSSTGDFNTSFSSSGGLMSWTFNMQQVRTSPAGFSSGSYGVAYVVGATSTLVATQGSGYAVVLGNTGTPDPLRFVSFSGGLNSLGTANTGLILATAPLSNPTNSYMSIRLTYNPSSSTWELFGRNDGTSGFSDPTTGTLTLLGTAVDSTYTGINLTSAGAYWQGSTAASQTSQFDNVRLEVVPEPSTYYLLLLSSLAMGFTVASRMRKNSRA